MLAGILTTLGFLGLIWLMYHTIKTNPDLFSRENLSRSFTTLGILALILIGVVGLAIILLRQAK